MPFPSQLSRAARFLDPLHVGSLRPDTRCQPSLQMRGATQKSKAHVFEHFGIQTNLRPSLRVRGRGMCSYQIACPCQSASSPSRCPTSCLGCAFGDNKCERQCTKLLGFTSSKCQSESSKPHAAHHHDYTPGDRGDEDPDSSTLEVVDKVLLLSSPLHLYKAQLPDFEGEGIIAYEWTTHSSNNKSPENSMQPWWVNFLQLIWHRN